MSTTDITDVKELLHTIRQEQRDMMQLLRGNPINPQDLGLLGRLSAIETNMESVEGRIESIENKGNRLFWTVSGAFTAVVGVAGVVAWIVGLFK